MALVSVIKRWRLREGMPMRDTARRTGLVRDTIRKYLVSGELEPRYPPRVSPSKPDPFKEALAGWPARKATQGRMRRRALKPLYGDLVVLGYRGFYDRVAAFARSWRRHAQEAARSASRRRRA